MHWQDQLNQLIAVHYQGRGAMTALADHLCVVKSTLYDWINGDNVPNEESRKAIEKLYDLRNGH